MTLLRNYLKQRTLGFVNEVRQSYGKDLLVDLMPGHRNSDDTCSVARSLGAGQTKYLESRIGQNYHAHPWQVILFIRLFDKGRFNEYDTPLPKGAEALTVEQIISTPQSPDAQEVDREAALV